ncbi:MAG: hypothetical protein RIB80_18510 [Rhodospirillales bacterium]
MDMHQTETAAPGQGHGGGVTGKSSVSNHTPKTPNFQLLDAALSEIDAARGRDATKADAAYHKRVADDLSNWLADDLLQARRRIPNEPKGRRVPPTMGDLRGMVDVQRRLAAARTEAELWDAATWAALNTNDPKWERLVMELSRAESHVAELEREAQPWK